MTPKEKAETLVAKFNVWTSRNNNAIHMEYDAKQCALICVDEIQEHAQMISTEYENYINAYEYFKDVQKEIEKL